jgi:hypothetical protein
MAPNTHLTTERLLLRPYELGDVADLHRTLHGDASRSPSSAAKSRRSMLSSIGKITAMGASL